MSTPLLHSGANELKIVVANTAINELAGRAAPDYRLLNFATARSSLRRIWIICNRCHQEFWGRCA